MSLRDPFHEGALAVQVRAGEQAAADRTRAMIASALPPGAQRFLTQLRMLAVSAVDRTGRLWASVWFGAPGFASSDDAHRLTLARPAGEDPVADGLQDGSELGVLAIDLSTRRRFRINGTIERTRPEAVTLLVREAFANCPKYVQPRPLRQVSTTSGTAAFARGQGLDDERRQAIASADTLFVGTMHPERGADASHRGGAPGFVRITGERSLRVPDYPGNGMFQTLGNIAVDARASIAVVDFERSRILSLTGHASLSFGEEDPRHPTGGTGRYWDLEVEEWVELPAPDLPALEARSQW